ncbi:bone morphogenetic protein receptor type-2 isoform X1 [Lampetra fluviatilis]
MAVAALLLLVVALAGLGSPPPVLCGALETVCAWSDSIPSQNPISLGKDDDLILPENGTVLCKGTSNCFGLWAKEENGESRVLKQGCWYHTGESKECTQDACRVTSPPAFVRNGTTRFCCCHAHMCNTNFTEDFADLPYLPTDPSQLVSQSKEEMVIFTLAAICFVAVLTAAAFLFFRLFTGNRKGGFHNIGLIEAPQPESTFDLDSLKLLQVVGRGRYSVVWRGSLDELPVAVKAVAVAHRQYFHNEKDIYRLPLMEHDNIARFVAAEERVASEGHHEYLLILEYYSHGSLSNYLTHHTSDWMSASKLAYSITRGLAYLHTELQRNDQYKPAIAHRDLNSRNVMVKSDGSCVLADFGFAMRLTGQRLVRPGEEDTAALNEVGTVRYMAPEVLEGAVNLHDCESALKQVDVYSLGLIYWEIYMRCSDLFPGESISDYQAAFQAELGNQPTIEDMQVLVSREKQRPKFPDAWKENSLAVRSLKETMEDCWDQDAEARLTAQCAEERITELMMLWDRNRSVSPTVNSTAQASSTAVQNERNLASMWRFPRLGPFQEFSSSSYIEDAGQPSDGFQKNLPSDHSSSGTQPAIDAKNRNSINYERQQAQSRAFSPDTSLTSLSASHTQTPGVPTTCLNPILEVAPGAIGQVTRSPIVAHVPNPACLHLTEADLKAIKIDPKEADKNLKESSDENLTETSSKQFSGKDPLSSSNPNLLYPLFRLASESSTPAELQPQVCQVPNASAEQASQPLPKQPNLPCRPTSLPFTGLVKARAMPHGDRAGGRASSSGKCNLLQVETGVAKMELQQVAKAQAVVMMVNSNAPRVNGVIPSCSSIAVNAPAMNEAALGAATQALMVEITAEPSTSTKVSGAKFQPQHAEENGLSSQHSSPDESQPLLGRPEKDQQPCPVRDSCSRRDQQSSEHLAADERVAALPSGPNVHLNSNNNNSNMAGVESASTMVGASLDVEATSERPHSLTLSVYDADAENSSSSGEEKPLSGEKIKRRVKTPYLIKQWLPTTWVVSADASGPARSLGGLNGAKAPVAAMLLAEDGGPMVPQSFGGSMV